MKFNTNTKAKSSKIKHTKGLAPPPTKEKKFGFYPALPFVKPAKDPDANK